MLDIKRDPTNYEDMIKKLREREQAEEERVRQELSNPSAEGALSENPEAIALARKRMRTKSNRRDYKALSADEKITRVDPTDPQVLEIKNRVVELSRSINTQLAQSRDPKVQRALLKGRVKLGGVEGAPLKQAPHAQTVPQDEPLSKKEGMGT